MYNPKTNLYDGLTLALPRQMFPWDEYFPRMAETDVLSGRGEVPSIKSFFIREAPFGGSYALLGGITDALITIDSMNFLDPDFLRGMRDMSYGDAFLDYLKGKKRMHIKVYSMPEGSVFFPNEPVITVEGPLPLIRLAEGIITEAVNFASLSLTKWYRLVRVTRPGNVLEFSRRRAQNHLKSSIYAMLAGCFASSNCEVRRFVSHLILGTMGHEWIQGYGDVDEAFDIWLTHQPGKPVGLIDTIQCLKIDFPAWLKAVGKHKEAIKEANPLIWGWRNDSGDLAYLTIEQYVMFMKHDLSKDAWFKERMRITLTNDLDEYAAQEIISQITAQAREAGLDANDILSRIIWAAGTKPGTCSDQSSLGGVMKLMQVDGMDCIKLAMDEKGLAGVKTSIPGYNASAWILDTNSNLLCSLIYPVFSWRINYQGKFEDSGQAVNQLVAYHPDNSTSNMIISGEYIAKPRQTLMFDGKTLLDQAKPKINEVTNRIQTEVDSLHWTHTRLIKPHIVKVSLNEGLFELRQQMIQQRVLRSDKLNRFV